MCDVFSASQSLTVVGWVGAALPVGSSCRRGAVITASIGGPAALNGVLSGKRRSSLRRHGRLEETGKKKT